MKYTTSNVHLIASPKLNFHSLREYLDSVGGGEWCEERAEDDYASDAETLVEAAGRMCYRSWAPGLNANVTRVRDDRGEYFENIMRSAHGSVLEHAQFSFILQNVSRVFTHELARHRAGTAISQESMRFVRIEDVPFFMPEWMQFDDYMLGQIDAYLRQGEALQLSMAEWFELDDPKIGFHEKKKKTSFMRRMAPEGITTDLVWSANVRTLRHVIDVRTEVGAEEEIRLVFAKVAEIMMQECPLLFADFTNDEGHYRPKYRKV